MILTVCQPILDIKMLATKDELQKLRLDSNGYLQANDSIKAMLDQLVSTKVHKEMPGGSCCNTIRAITAKTEIETAFIGAIGNDRNGRTLLAKLSEEKVNHRLEKINDKNTAVCVVLINNNERSLVTDFGAVNCLTMKYIIDNDKLLMSSKVIYLCGFFVVSMPENAKYLITKIESQKLIFNLSNEGILANIETDLLKEIMRRSEVVIGNFDEMKKLRSILYSDKYTTVDEMMVVESRNSMIFISTNAEKNVHYGYNGVLGREPAKKLTIENLDSCGAGDYFAGGFISAYYKKDRSMEECVKEGCEWAGEYIEAASTIF